MLAAFAGSPYAGKHGQVDVPALARTVEREDDHVTAIELARWIRDRRDGLRIVDVRTTAEFDAWHLPAAERIPLASLATTPFRRSDTIVLYSEGGAHAAQGWVFLRALGYSQVYFLRGGLNEWLDEVMNPTIRTSASATERAAFDSVAALSRYFGGVPQVADSTGVRRGTGGADARPAPRGASTAAAVLRQRRRSC